MARTQYGPVVVATPGAGETLTSEKAPVVVSRTQGGAPETDLQTLAGTPISQPDPNDTTGAAAWLGPNGYAGAMWVQDPNTGTWWEVLPVGIADRIGGVSSVSVNGGTPQTGAVNVTSLTSVSSANITDASTVGKASLTAGSTSAAQSAIGGTEIGKAVFGAATTSAAQTAIGGSAVGKQVFTAGTTAAARAAIEALKAGDVPAFGDWSDPANGQIPVWDDTSGSFLPGNQVLPPTDAFALRGAVLNPGQATPANWPNGAIAFVRDSAPVLSALDAGGNGTGNSATTLATTLTESIETTDDLLVTFVAASPGSVLSTVTVTDSAGGGTPNTYTTRGQRLQGATVQVQEFKCRPTTRLAAGSSVTLSLGGSVGAIAVKLTKVTGLAAPSSDQLGQNSKATTDRVTVAAGGSTAQASELATVAIGFTSTGNTVVDPTTWNEPGWTQIGDTQSSGGTNPKFAAVFMRVLTAVETPSVTPQVSSAAGSMVAALVTHKAA